jgi:hypothetical protein
MATNLTDASWTRVQGPVVSADPYCTPRATGTRPPQSALKCLRQTEMENGGGDLQRA